MFHTSTFVVVVIFIIFVVEFAFIAIVCFVFRTLSVRSFATVLLVVVFLFGAGIRVQEIPAAGLEEAWNTELKSQKPPILKCQVRQRKRLPSRPINTLLFK